MARAIDGFYAGGSWKKAAKTFQDFNPANDELYAEVADATVEDVRDAIASAHGAFASWSELPFTERAAFMLKIADEIEKRQDILCSAIQAEAGSWFGKGMFESGYIPGVFRAAAALSYAPIGEVLPSEHNKVSLAVRRAMGVVTVISPWNFPALLTARGFAFAMVAGNTIVLKPSEETPYSGGLFFAEVMEAVGLPAGVFNVVTCSRDNIAEIGDELIINKHVKGISFTGSTPVGRMIASKAGQHLKKCCVELGGKDSLIICDDADLEKSAQTANFGAFMHQGQICMSVEKVLVHESIYDTFVPKFVERAAKLKVGDPTTDKSNIIGPLINDKQVAQVKAQLEDAIAKGAKVLVGGKIEGRFVEPTILEGVTPDMLIYQNETFGPVVPVIKFSTDAEAVQIANDTEYGLSSGVMTENEKRGLEIASMLETGISHVNCSSVNDEPHIPFGGSKASGVGRHGGRWSMETFTETRWITLERGGRHFPPMF
ncbi:aldehyde dehydrogenase family protein [Roseibium sp. CAU 1637]|uniref:Aldehyde dehydrogenase family protein n=1 Tax=Roseibium limicola TaxID=2816037 RepID=A0A939EP44_9HYPH|nr:aldehyde dehydrogenase family protein [Roseibium limicola]MBO0345376.1 aldehyde dehydrogenase family protein [Roseibium limicola]